MKRHWFIKFICVVAVLGLSITQAENSINKDPAIFWDEAGNIHLFTNSEAELHFAWGWAQMRDNTKLLLNTIQSERQNVAKMVPEAQAENYQFFADGMTGFLNRRLDTLTPAHRAMLPLQSADVMSLMSSELGGWRDVYLHQSDFLGAGTSSLGFPQFTVDNTVLAVDRVDLMGNFEMLELLAPLSQNE